MQQALAFETRRYAAMMGCSTEFTRYEGVTYSQVRYYRPVVCSACCKSEGRRRRSGITDTDKYVCRAVANCTLV